MIVINVMYFSFIFKTQNFFFHESFVDFFCVVVADAISAAGGDVMVMHAILHAALISYEILFTLTLISFLL